MSSRDYSADLAPVRRIEGAVVALAVMVALALLVSMGGDGRDLEDHALWMGRMREEGTVVVW